MLNIKENELLKNHTSIRIGGPAKYFVNAASSAEVEEAIAWAQAKNLSLKVIGGGSNLLVSDNGYSGMVIKFFGSRISIAGDIMEVGGGTPLALAMNDSLKAGLIGLEWAIGIPGTVGGATCNNAGAYGGEMSQIVMKVKILIDGVVKELDNNECGFAYRRSAFKTDSFNGVILSVQLKLARASEEELNQAKVKVDKILSERKNKFAQGPSAGSIFRNIILTEEEIAKFKAKFPELPDQFVGYQKIPAAWLIDECGLKGKQIGGAKVSDNHAGIIVNTGAATAEEVIMLVSIIKQKVRSRFNLQLMEEVEYLGF